MPGEGPPLPGHCTATVDIIYELYTKMNVSSSAWCRVPSSTALHSATCSNRQPRVTGNQAGLPLACVPHSGPESGQGLQEMVLVF